MARRVFHLIAAVMLGAISFALAIPAAHADDLGNFLGQVNALRAAHGLAPLTVDPTLDNDAQAWTEHIASTGVLEDDPQLAAQVGGGWTRLGENTAYGSAYDLLFNALVNSPPHLANMLGTYTLTGVGEVVTSQFTWVTEIFEEPSSAAPLAPVAPVVQPVSSAKVVAPVHHTVATTPAPPRTTTTAPAPTTTTVAPTTTSTTSPPPPTVPTTNRSAAAPTTAPTHAARADLALTAHEAPGGSLRDLILGCSMAMMLTIAGVGWLIARSLHRR